ncbi:hypothetical protein J2S74_001896 [Evansella vedderi]|uniref:Uncharacterized protein n=1 Tax=Evansella vedderi TaxID=38282 RepID=A0ABT9ZUW1_9BACI|nr:hypothetical protein [Evansella vedderi]
MYDIDSEKLGNVRTELDIGGLTKIANVLKNKVEKPRAKVIVLW